MKVGYYPGCALHGSSNDYEQSVRACLAAFDVELNELEEWICCGATAAHALNHRLSVALPARNLALAKQQGWDEMLAPGPMCSMQLLKANSELRKPAVRQEMEEIVELQVDDSIGVLNILDLLHKLGEGAISQRVMAPLEDCQPACYYGCLLTRPQSIVNFDDPERPSSMERLLEACGAQPVDWNYRTKCCGAGMTLSNEETVLELSHEILADAIDNGASCLVVACPMCHVNLDMKQPAIERRYEKKLGLPVYYVTDLVGRAVGLDDRALGINRHFVAVG